LDDMEGGLVLFAAGEGGAGGGDDEEVGVGQVAAVLPAGDGWEPRVVGIDSNHASIVGDVPPVGHGCFRVRIVQVDVDVSGAYEGRIVVIPDEFAPSVLD